MRDATLALIFPVSTNTCKNKSLAFKDSVICRFNYYHLSGAHVFPFPFRIVAVMLLVFLLFCGGLVLIVIKVRLASTCMRTYILLRGPVVGGGGL